MTCMLESFLRSEGKSPNGNAAAKAELLDSLQVQPMIRCYQGRVVSEGTKNRFSRNVRHAIAVGGVRISSVGMGLLHGSLKNEHEEFVWFRLRQRLQVLLDEYGIVFQASGQQPEKPLT